MESAKETERHILENLMEALQALPHVKASRPTPDVREAGGRHEVDAEIRIDAGGREVILLVEVKKSVFPRDVREILWQLEKYSRLIGSRSRSAAVPLLAAESMSLGAKALLREENVGYYDTGGSLFVPARGAYIFIEKPPPKTLEKSVRSLFKGKRAQVIHALLVKHGEWFGATALAELAEVAPSTASETLIALERFDWLRSRGQGPTKARCLANPGALLDEWGKQVEAGRPRGERRHYVPQGEPDALVERLAAACDTHDVSYAITREAAAQRYAPFLSSLSRVACRMAPGRAADEALAALDARPVDEGANLAVIETPSRGEFLFKERVGGAWLASAVQVYLDLLCGEGRSRDMARHLRRQRIGF